MSHPHWQSLYLPNVGQSQSSASGSSWQVPLDTCGQPHVSLLVEFDVPLVSTAGFQPAKVQARGKGLLFSLLRSGLREGLRGPAVVTLQS